VYNEPLKVYQSVCGAKLGSIVEHKRQLRVVPASAARATALKPPSSATAPANFNDTGGKGISTMSEITIYHNPRCSKSRQALQLLEEQGIQPNIVLYLENPPSKRQLQDLLKKLGIGARALLRTGEDEYKQQNLADTTLGEAALIDAMVEHPKLIERPIVVRGAHAAIGRPPENILKLLAR
jgi:arsenate reductase